MPLNSDKCIYIKAASVAFLAITYTAVNALLKYSQMTVLLESTDLRSCTNLLLTALESIDLFSRN